MKKFMVLVCVLGMSICGLADDANSMFYVPVLAPLSGITNRVAVLGDAVDTLGYKGNCAFVVYSSASWTNTVTTNTVTLYTCATSGGSYQTLTNIAGEVGALAFTFTAGATENVKTYKIGSDRLLRYVKAGYVATGPDSLTNHTASVVFVSPYKTN